MHDTKKCTECKQEQSITNFRRASKNKDGLQYACKTCRAKRDKEYTARPEIQEKLKIYRREYFSRPDVKERMQEYNSRPEVKARRALKQRAYQKTARWKEWWAKYKSKGRTSATRARDRARSRARYKNDILYRMRMRMSTAVGRALKRNNGSKLGESVMKYLPYDMKDLKEHLENLFVDNMSWENYGTDWQIDHIYPQSKLPYDSMQHPNFQKAWALKNLRPLGVSENLSKNDKIDEVLLKEYGLESYIEGKI